MSQFLKSGQKAFALASSSLKSVVKQQVRQLNVHEYVGIKILSENGVNVPKFGVANTPEEARTVAASLKGTYFCLSNFKQIKKHLHHFSKHLSLSFVCRSIGLCSQSASAGWWPRQRTL